MTDTPYTKGLLRRLTEAQITHVHEMTKPPGPWQYSDDGWDYLQTALLLAHDMLHLYYDDDLEGLQQLLTTDLQDYACDGIAPAFYDLNPPALQENDDE